MVGLACDPQVTVFGLGGGCDICEVDHILIVDIFGGSNTTGQVAEKLNRRWLTFELSSEYVAASVFRFSANVEAAKQQYENILAGNHISL